MTNIIEKIKVSLAWMYVVSLGAAQLYGGIVVGKSGLSAPPEEIFIPAIFLMCITSCVVIYLLCICGKVLDRSLWWVTYAPFVAGLLVSLSIKGLT